MDSLYILGIIFAILATSLFNLVPVLQKSALDDMAEISFKNLWSSLKKMITNKRWILGIVFGILGTIPYVLSVDWAGISVVQPLQSFGFIVLVVSANRMLKEKLNTRAKIAIFLMILMPVFIALGEVSDSTLDISEPEAQMNLFLFVGALSLACLIMWFFGSRFPFLFTLICAIFFCLGAIATQAALDYVELAGYDLISDFGTIVGNIFSDSNLRMVIVFLVMMIFIDVFAGLAMQIGLQKIAASKFQPTQQSLNNLFSVIGGIVIFGQSIGNLVFYIIGFVFAIIGTIILGKYQLPPAESIENIPPPIME